MYLNQRIIVIAPCLNEREKIQKVCERVLAESSVDELVVVDDCSTDGSDEVSAKAGATVIKLKERSGVGAAIREGFNYAAPRCDILVVIAGNNKDEPKEIPRLLNPIIKEGADFVQGSRFLPGGGYGGDMPFYRKIATRLHPLLFSLASGKRVTESTNGFRALKTSLLKDERIRLDQKWLNSYELEPYLLFKAVTLGYKTCEVPVTKIYPPKKIGNTKMVPFLDWWKILKPVFYLWSEIKK